ncbi:MAG: nucleotidyltransferase domain-containing protein [Saprospiraceae bacterium]|nr:nucleotidyltransferase domain-containing protein [Saprospiraceae bacterium]
MTIEQLHTEGCILFECISGSRAYGTHLPTSDTDIKGVFVMPEERLFGLGYVEQVNDARNDVVYYELRRFVELLMKNNPNILEMLNSPEDCILHKDPLFDLLITEMFLSKLCKNAFAGYAWAQIKKAQGLNKKIVNPMSKERKTILEFCYVAHEQGSIPLSNWLKNNNLEQERCGLVNIPNMMGCFSVFYDTDGSKQYKGIMRKDEANDLLLSSVVKGEKPMGLLFFNKDGYSKYCKDYREYWEWVENRNEARYENTVASGKNYDAKNMMHTFRLLDMAEEMLKERKVNVRRPNREELLAIRRGEFEYADLIAKAERKLVEIDAAFDASDLPEMPDVQIIEPILIDIRQKWYEKKRIH